ncbi:nucleotide-binding domain-containing protein [Azospirillum sp.]|uniref:nucleotide-binding domain-containing protein n=1 Tax=Azospirillum sp. TaxID=34012 RepID=UPI003D70C018
MAITCGLAKREGAPVYGTLYSGVGVLPKGSALRFTVANTNVPPPYNSIRRIVQNKGDDARAAGQMGWQQDNGGMERWTGTVYRGDHSMACQIHRGGVVLAETVHRVRIRDEARRGFFRHPWV